MTKQEQVGASSYSSFSNTSSGELIWQVCWVLQPCNWFCMWLNISVFICFSTSVVRCSSVRNLPNKHSVNTALVLPHSHYAYHLSRSIFRPKVRFGLSSWILLNKRCSSPMDTAKQFALLKNRFDTINVANHNVLLFALSVYFYFIACIVHAKHRRRSQGARGL